jgi:hypothetical protein
MAYPLLYFLLLLLYWIPGANTIPWTQLLYFTINSTNNEEKLTCFIVTNLREMPNLAALCILPDVNFATFVHSSAPTMSQHDCREQ